MISYLIFQLDKGGERIIMIQLTRAMRPKLPTLGLKLQTSYESCFQSVRVKYFNETNAKLYKIIKCKYCGLLSIKYIGNGHHKRQFCSVACATKYLGQQKTINNLKSAIKIVDNTELKFFLKDYSNFVYSEIYNNYPKEYQEDLIDYWSEKSLILFANIKRAKIERKNVIFKYLRTFLKYGFLRASKIKEKEVFYDELSHKNYSIILGDDKRER